MAINVGDTVKVKNGIIDPDFGNDISGWQGKIFEVENDIVCIDWDSITLSNCPDEYIQRCEEDGLDWEQIYLSTKDVEIASQRDTTSDLYHKRESIYLKHKWDYLGKSSKRIHEVLEHTNITNEDEIMDAWEKYLSNKLSYPFDAEISQYQNKGPLQQGDKIRVHGIIGSDDLYGVLVKVKLRLGKKVFHFPLCDTEVANKGSNNHMIVDDYNAWFANR